MDRVQTIIKAQQVSAVVLAHVARAKELLAGANCRKLAEEDLLISPFDLRATLRGAREELAHFIRRSLARASIGGDEAVGSA